LVLLVGTNAVVAGGAAFTLLPLLLEFHPTRLLEVLLLLPLLVLVPLLVVVLMVLVVPTISAIPVVALPSIDSLASGARALLATL
jgi:hypothetical protein